MKMTYKISGMHCASCEKLVAEELKTIDGVTSAKVDSRRGQAELELAAPLDLQAAAAKLKPHGYGISSGGGTVSPKFVWRDWLSAIFIVVALYVGYRALVAVGLFSDLNLGGREASLAGAALIGLAASLSTCLVAVGAVVTGLGAKFSGARYVRAQLIFQAGRLSGFFLLGGALGALGGIFNFSPLVFASITLILALVLLLFGLNLLGWLPASVMTRLSPKFFNRQMNSWSQSNSPVAPLIIGALTFFIPCGFTQSMQILAVASHNFMTGALIMLFFSLGTLPVLLILGLTAAKFTRAHSPRWRLAAGLILLIFAVSNFQTGLALWRTTEAIAVESQDQIVNQTSQTIKMTVDYRGFTPNNFNLKTGVPVVWLIDGKDVSGCTNEIIVPALKIKKKLAPGINIVQFTPENVGTIQFSCWMGMVRGRFVVNEQ